MCTGVGLFSPPSVASASEVTVTNVTGSGTTVDPYVVKPDGSVIPTAGEANAFYAPTANVLNITGTFSADKIYFCGGYNPDNSATCVSGKTINVKGTNIFVKSIYGGVSESGNGNVEGNTVNVESGTIRLNSIGGGLVQKFLGPSSVKGGSALGNHVNITGGKIGGKINLGGDDDGCTIYGGDGAIYGDAENNTVTISGGEIHSKTIYGGWTSANGKKANGNIVTINGGTVIVDSNSSIYGGAASSIRGSNAIEANGNTVTIDGGTVNVGKAIYGGSAGSVMEIINTEASGNTVTIGKDATLLGSEMSIFGGHAMSQSGFTQVQMGTTNNNTVNILKAITVKQIVGGSNLTEGTGNTLNIALTSPTTIPC